MIRRPPRSTQSRSSAASDVYKRQEPLQQLLREREVPEVDAVADDTHIDDGPEPQRGAGDTAPLLAEHHGHNHRGPDDAEDHRLGEQLTTSRHLPWLWDHRHVDEPDDRAPRHRREPPPQRGEPVSYTHLRAHETDSYLVCRLLL